MRSTSRRTESPASPEPTAKGMIRPPGSGTSPGQARDPEASSPQTGGAHEERPPWWRRGLILGAAAVAAVAVGVGATHTPIFRVRSIEVVGTERLTDARVVDLAGVGPSTNTVYLDRDSAEAALEEDAWIAEATVVRRLPSSLEIEVRERSPLALVASGSGYQLVAGDGVLLGSATEETRLPVIGPANGVDGPARPVTADAAAEAATIVRAMGSRLRSEVGRVVARDGGFDLELRSGAVVNYGGAVEQPAKAAALTAILQWERREGERLVSVDLRVPASPVTVLARNLPDGDVPGG